MTLATYTQQRHQKASEMARKFLDTWMYTEYWDANDPDLNIMILNQLVLQVQDELRIADFLIDQVTDD
jgi:hypothetical protein